PNDAAARGSRLSHKIALPEFFPPIGSEAAVGGARHGIFIDAGTRSEETGNEIEFLRLAAACHDNPAGLHSRQQRDVWIEFPHPLLRIDLDQIIELTLPDVNKRDPERFL